jgi:hypothetical protein
MSPDMFDSAVADWLQEGPDRGPRHGLERALAAARRVDQRPRWVFPQRWLPRAIALPRTPRQTLARFALLVLLGLLLAIALSVVFGGPPPPPRIESPFGRAGQTLVAFQEGDAIAVARIDGSLKKTLTGALPFARWPTFSPDGKWLAFVAPSAAGNLGGRLMVVPANGSTGPFEVGHGKEVVAAAVVSLAWSPDSRRVAYAVLDNGVSRIFLATLDGAPPVALTDETANRDLPTWSQDGTRIAYREKDFDGLRTSLRLVSPDGGEAEIVTMMIASDAYLSKLRFGPPNFPYTYWWNAGFGTETSSHIDFAFGHHRGLYTGAPPAMADFGVPWSPDGKLLAVMTRTDGVVVINFVNDANEDQTPTHRTFLGHVADCWIDWAPDGTGLIGGSLGDCSQTVLIPLTDPSRSYTLPGSASGIASWQPPAP